MWGAILKRAARRCARRQLSKPPSNQQDTLRLRIAHELKSAQTNSLWTISIWIASQAHTVRWRPSCGRDRASPQSASRPTLRTCAASHTRTQTHQERPAPTSKLSTLVLETFYRPTLLNFHHCSNLRCIAWNPLGTLVATGSSSKTLRVCEFVINHEGQAPGLGLVKEQSADFERQKGIRKRHTSSSRRSSRATRRPLKRSRSTRPRMRSCAVSAATASSNFGTFAPRPASTRCRGSGTPLRWCGRPTGRRS